MPMFIRVSLNGGGSYVQPIDSIADAIEGETDGLSLGDKITLTLEVIEMSQEQYDRLPEFAGH